MSKINSPMIPFKVDILLCREGRFIDTFRKSSPARGRLLDALRPSYWLQPNPSDASGVASYDVTIDPSRNLWVRVYLPSSLPSRPAGLPVLLFLHGGWFSLYSPASGNYHRLCIRYAGDLPAVVVSVNFRLAPEHRCPAQYHDCLDVLRALDGGRLDSLLAGRADLSSCFVVGDCTGGNLAHHVARMWAEEQCGRRVRLAGVVAIQPAFGGEERVASETGSLNSPLVTVQRMDWMWRTFLPEGENRDHWAANVFGPRDCWELGELFPAAMVVYAWFDRFVDRGRAYAQGLRVRERGKEVVVVEYPEMFHAFYLFPEVPQCQMLLDEIRSFVQRFSTDQPING